MPTIPPTHTSLADQLTYLEDLYAEQLMLDSDPVELTAIWNTIKTLRAQLELPVYSYVTPKELRQ